MNYIKIFREKNINKEDYENEILNKIIFIKDDLKSKIYYLNPNNLNNILNIKFNYEFISLEDFLFYNQNNHKIVEEDSNNVSTQSNTIKNKKPKKKRNNLSEASSIIFVSDDSSTRELRIRNKINYNEDALSKKNGYSFNLKTSSLSSNKKKSNHKRAKIKSNLKESSSNIKKNNYKQNGFNSLEKNKYLQNKIFYLFNSIDKKRDIESIENLRKNNDNERMRLKIEISKKLDEITLNQLIELNKFCNPEQTDLEKINLELDEYEYSKLNNILKKVNKFISENRKVEDIKYWKEEYIEKKENIEYFERLKKEQEELENKKHLEEYMNFGKDSESDESDDNMDNEDESDSLSD